MRALTVLSSLCSWPMENEQMLLKRTGEFYVKPDGRESSRIIENMVYYGYCYCYYYHDHYIRINFPEIMVAWSSTDQ